MLGSDTIPLQNEWVSLHQVTVAQGSLVDSALTDRLGVYVLSATTRDTSALYISSVRFRDITYFSSPVRSVQFTADTASTLFVFDTSSVGPPLDLVQRHLVIRRAGEDGTRSVLELIVLANRGNVARIAGSDASPVWRSSVPSGAFGLQMGESDVSSEALLRSGDSLSLVAPVPPGQKQLVYSYSLPRERELAVPVDQSTERFQLLLEDTSAVVSGSLRLVGIEQLDEIRFVRYEASFVPAGAPVVINFSDQPFLAADYWWLVVIAAMLAFLGAVVLWWHRVEPVTSDDPEVLAARIAMLDESYERERSEMSDGDRTNYENARADLKARLNVALARKNYAR